MDLTSGLECSHFHPASPLIYLEIFVKPHPNAVLALLARPLPLDVVVALPEEVAASRAGDEEVAVDAHVAGGAEPAAWE